MCPTELQKQQITALLEKLTDHRWDEAADVFAGDNPAFEDVPANIRFSGTQGIARAYESFATALPDLALEVATACDVPGCSVRELLITGTHLGAYQGLEPTGRRVRLPCACFFRFDSTGRLMTERIYFDNETLVRQMSGRSQPYLPKLLRVAA